MASKMRLDIVTPDRIVYSKNVNRVIASTPAGDLDILPGHSWRITSLEISAIKIIRDKNEQQLSLSGGFIEVHKNKLMVLASFVETQTEIDGKRAKAARVQKELKLNGGIVLTRRARIRTYHSTAP
ncbi:ATP synthase F1 subunit epsilon [Sporomusa termitida]|uniref:ATP synthase epsilon chain n=1 Tax=Sporomusa termitida TaxID=2377 RepID=A0A517DVY8_9FIRM|nr:ATP synthase F1 subunit epsilon [Sporomusa termitida]QDR81436.1 ATP synthase epsilon chain [Sporomusa termitida]